MDPEVKKVLDMKYAQGEISEEEYKKRLALIQEKQETTISQSDEKKEARPDYSAEAQELISEIQSMGTSLEMPLTPSGEVKGEVRAGLEKMDSRISAYLTELMMSVSELPDSSVPEATRCFLEVLNEYTKLIISYGRITLLKSIQEERDHFECSAQNEGNEKRNLPRRQKL